MSNVARSGVPGAKPRHNVPPGLLAASIGKADVNGDGRLSGLEWIDAHFTDFDAVDENADGKLTVEELDAFAILVFKKGAQ